MGYFIIVKTARLNKTPTTIVHIGYKCQILDVVPPSNQ